MVATQTPAFTQPEPLDPETLFALRRARLADFLHVHWCDGIDELTKAIRQAVLAGGGDWIAPTTGNRPASHLVEISLYGATATGCTLDEAVRNWRRVAERLALSALDEDAA